MKNTTGTDWYIGANRFSGANAAAFTIGRNTSRDIAIHAGNSNDLLVLKSNNIGIGTSSPSEKLEVSGKTKTTNFQMTNGATNGYVLQSDASGNASWVDIAGVILDTNSVTNNSAVCTTGFADVGPSTINVTGATSTFTVNTYLRVTINLSTSSNLVADNGYYSVYLINPSGNELNLTNGYANYSNATFSSNLSNTVSQNNLNVPVSGSYGFAGNNISDFYGDAINGTWSIVLDYLTGGNGTATVCIDSWTLEVVENGRFGDNLGNHSAQLNIRLNDHYLSNDGDNEGIKIDNDGKVGIGTSTPSNKLHVLSDGSTEGNYTSVVLENLMTNPLDGKTKTNLEIRSSGNWGVFASNNIGLYVSQTTGAVFNYDALFNGGGNVGIGTSTPSEKLEVNGKTKTTNFQMTNGATDGYVLSSDASGNASWVNATSLSGVIRSLGNSRFIGFTSGQNASGATFGNSSQQDIIAIGDSAGYSAGSFGNLSSHIALGQNTLYGLTGGTGNIAIGNKVLSALFGTVFYNTAVGYQAISLSPSGNPQNNTAFGAFALQNSSSSNNTAVGYQAGKTIDNGSSNTFVGYKADASSSTLTNATAIGANTTVSSSNSLILGNNANVGIGTSSPTSRLHVYNSSGATNIAVQSATSNAYLSLNNGGSGFEDAIATYTNGSQRWLFGKSNGAESGSNAGSDFFINRYDDAGTYLGQPLTITRSTGQVNVAGTLSAAALKMTTGAASGYLLKSDASGNGSWVNPLSIKTDTLSLIADADADTKVETEQSANENFIRFTLGGTEYFKMNKATIEVNNSGKCVYVGNSAGASDSYTILGLDGRNTGIGANALQSVNTSSGGVYNTALGTQSLQNTSSGSQNTAVGYSAGSVNTSGAGNTFVGSSANAGSASLSNATAIGANAIVSASNSLVLGNNANVGIGTSSPSEKLEVAGKTKTTDFQMTNGATTGYVLQSDANGNASWVSPSVAGYWTANGNNIYNNNSGFVGVGNTSPSVPLHVYSSSTSQDRMLRVDGSATNGTWLDIKNSASGGGNWSIIAAANGNSEGGGSFALKDNNNGTRMVIRSNGRVGIGTQNPTNGFVEISGSVTYPTSGVSFRYYNNSSSGNSSTTGSETYSLYASARIGASEFNAFSDARIKHILGRTNNEDDLNKLMQLQVTNYKMIDTIAKGSREYKKVIAQEVEQVYPNAVSQHSDFIPNIYALAEMENGFVKLNNADVKVGDKLKLIFGSEQTEALVKEISATGFVTDLKRSGNVFVYGKEVSDFRTVDYEALSVLNISATQALVKRLLEAESKIAAGEKQTENLQQQLIRLAARVSALDGLEVPVSVK